MIDLEFLKTVAEAAMQKERDACIKVVERFMLQEEQWSLADVVEAIKERGEIK